ncbi:DUF488 domain-containing protein [Mycobacterium colombiense]|uniref:DUF488 domain-containing protein n=1 Tax=Mycobacterium colombiense TaxID=339268 RepID=A0A329K9D3_9MYCO|nr:DUF488 domain-containing protein [Mycobacterium colombiense]RAU92528.1 DUF488 domain-containing protein [Mycobacterium colombiense]
MLLTVGHGAARRERLTELLAGAGVALVVDVRRYPASRTNPDVRRETLESWLPQGGIDYRWEPRLGGRRHIAAGEPEPDSWWTVAAFRAYAAYTRTPEFDAALDDVLADAVRRTTAVMCSESVWWRCHRRLIADVAVLGRGVAVRHLMPDGRLGPHRPAEGARRRPDGHLVWDG